ncbi:hypothetical protein W02_05730 [Nitrospira sp. KM1]|uniref:TrkA C-terminal domain-containing protein n=1 Tax=Nitrospira sp. KM1 TaxID=1936990 RepID=UPI0013A741DB|nr:TrkA C-terminal domain-containing protein [Nitrospira sp. KM1]BCA53433.1 hypothetical protein W02_05730 [Nitrospira sp. KM1]
MSLEFLGRLQKELSLTGNAVYESVLAIAERVNRKVQILRLHAQAASLLSQIESVQGELGRLIADASPSKSFSPKAQETRVIDLDNTFKLSVDRVHELKQTLIVLDSQIRELKMETVHENLLTLQRDLGLRGVSLERFIVADGSAAVGKSTSDVPGSVRLFTIFRGPFLLTPSDTIPFRRDDVVIVIAARSDLEALAAWFAPVRRVKTA